MKYHIYLFRHGQTYYNASKRFAGRANSHLNPIGLAQANLIAEKLRDKQFQLAYTTGLSRSSESLKIVLKYHPECKKVIVDKRLIERSYGAFQRKLHKTIIRKYGKAQFDIWHRSYDIAPPDGESIELVERRVVSFIKDLIDLIKSRMVNVAICAHNNSMRPFRRYFETLSIEEMMELENPYDKYFDYIVEC